MSSNQHHHFGLGTDQEEQALQDLLQFPFVDALFGRRSRRFFRGDEIPDGPLAYKSRYEPLPLTELEKLLILTAVGGNTGWHHSITRHARYAPHLSNYPAAAGGRTFPSAPAIVAIGKQCLRSSWGVSGHHAHHIAHSAKR